MTPDPRSQLLGSRSKLGERFFDDLYDLWQYRGMEVLESAG
jgi:hypothetical protein